MTSNVTPIFYTVNFAAVAVSAVQDLLAIVAPADADLIVPKITIGQQSEEGDAQAEMLGLTIKRGATGAGSGGGAVTPVSLDPRSDAVAFTARKNDTTQATGGTVETIWADAFNVARGFSWSTPVDLDDPRRGQIVVKAGTRLVLSLDEAPADAITMSASMLVAELR